MTKISGYGEIVEEYKCGKWLVKTECRTSLHKCTQYKQKFYFCTYCGASYKQLMKFCGNCGKNMSVKENSDGTN